jgi:cell wall-associated NlpC family hydrolase
MVRQMDGTERPRRWRTRAALGVGGAVILLGGGFAVTAATGASQDPAHQLRVWTLDAPALPLPVDETPAPVADEPQGDAESDPGSRTDGDRDAPDRSRDSLPSGAASDAEVEAALARALGAKSGGDGLVSRATLNPDGTATIPPDAPPRVAAIIQAGNEVARKPYVYGGGHGRFANSVWSDTAYDCSGSISFTLAAAGMIDAPMTSGALADWGEPGPGKWVTIYANAEHTFMYVAGLRFDTSGRQVTGSRWQTASRNLSGFRVVHPKGL